MIKTSKIALIFGVTGQDGSYLSELLLDKGYIVHGVKRRSSSHNTSRIDHLYKDPHEKDIKFFLHYGDLTDSTNIIRIIQETKPDEIYSLGALSHVKVSFDAPEYTANTNGIGTLRILEAIRLLGMTEKVKFYNAATSEMYGLVQETPQTEKTPFYPRSPYAVSKVFGFDITRNYREAYDMFACSGILFNHCSERRGETFLSKKVVMAATRISYGLQDKLYLGNLNAKRDFGYAKDYINAMYLMLQQDKPDDYVIASGETHSVREFVEIAFKEVGIVIQWEGEGLNEIGIDQSFGKTLIEIDQRYFRPTEVDLLLGDPSRAIKELGWERTVTFQGLIKGMIEHEIDMIRQRKA